MRVLLSVLSGLAAFSLGALSVDLSRCQYSLATGDSERLEQSAGALEFPAMKLSGREAVRSCRVTPGDQAKEAELNVRYSGGPLTVRVDFFNADGTESRPALTRILPAAGGVTAKKLEMMIVPGTASIRVTLSGTAAIERAAWQLSEVTQWTSVRLFPAAFIDNTFAVEKDACTPMIFTFQNIRKERPKNAVVVVTLPRGFSFVASGNVFPLLDKKTLQSGDTVYRFADKLHGYTQYNPHHSAPLLITSDLPAGDKRYPMSYFMEYEGLKTRSYTSYLTVLPNGGRSAVPRLFRSGFIAGNDIAFDGRDGGAVKLMAHMTQSGFNSAQLPVVRPIQDAAKKSGMERLWSDWWFVNGFTLGREKKPSEVIFRDENGKSVYHTQWHDGLCPVEAYTGGAYFRDHVIGYIEDRIFRNDLGDHVIANWEPLVYDFKGCFCNRCRDEFIKYSKLPAAEVRAAWPKNIIAKYRSAWIKFRSWQHAQLIIAIRRGFDELEKKYNRKLIFIPEVAWSNLFSTSLAMYEQYDLLDYIDQLQWINPWGPYIFQQTNRPFVYKAGVNLGTYVAAREMKKKVAEFVPDKKRRPKLLAFPHGVQCNTWMTTPEALAYETLAFFVHGWEGSYAYLFPSGYDARYYRAMRNANRGIAAYENFTFNGKKGDFATCRILSPLPGPAYVDSSDNPTLAELAKDIVALRLVTCDSYKLGDRTFVAVGNAWQGGEAFAAIGVRDLPPAGKYVIYSPDRNLCFGRNLSAAQLAAGVTVEIPALGWAFFVVEPEKEGRNYGQMVTQQEIAGRLTGAMARLRQAESADMALIRESNEVVLYNFGAQPLLQSDRIKIAPAANLTDSVLTVNAPGYEARLDMGKGGVLSQLKYNGRQLADSVNPLFRDGFHAPVNAIMLNERPYRFVRWTPVAGGVEVELENRITAKASNFLRGMEIRKKYTFTADRIKLDVTLHNATGKTLESAYRLHNMLPSLAHGDGFELGGAKQTRNGKLAFYQFGEQKMTRGPFDAEIGGTFSQAEAVFPGWSLRTVSAAALQGVFVWDSPRGKVCSFELFFRPVKLAPGKKCGYSFELNLRKEK